MTHLGTRRAGWFAVLTAGVAFTCLSSHPATGGDWPQWRGINRDARATGFTTPKQWPKELTQKWKVSVGNGVASPALVGDRLFVFARDGGSEVTRCLDANTGKELWKESYEAEFKGRGDQGYPGPRSSPSVADGKVVTFGVNGTLSCLNSANGTKLWRIETGARPTFHTSSSPLVADNLVVIQVGSEKDGGVNAYDLENGKAKWKWTEEGVSYSSPVLMSVGDTKMVVAMASKSVVGIGLADGKTKWKVAFPLPGQRNYNASTPTVNGDIVIFSGSRRGTKAVKVEKQGDGFAAKELWTNKDGAVMYNSPVVKKGEVYGLAASDTLFCINEQSGKTAWTHQMNGRRGYGTIVDAGPVLMALTPASKLLVFEPGEKDFNEVANYSVGTGVYAYPIVTGNRIYVKDKDSVILWELK